VSDLIAFDSVIVGGGVVGMSIALEMQKSGCNTIVVEKNNFLGDEVSSRSSGVLHSGIYYPSGSLKAQLTYRGNQLLYDYADRKEIPFKRIGKIIVGRAGDQDRLLNLIENGHQNGVEGLSALDFDDLNSLEPNLSKEIKFGIFSENTGVIDVPSLVRSYELDFESHGGTIIKNSSFLEHQLDGKDHIVLIQTGNEKFTISSKFLVFAMGLHSYEAGKKIEPIAKSQLLKEINLCKGHYYKISGFTPFNHLIYPLPGTHGLGIHYTIDVSGASKFGPDVEFVKNHDFTFSINSKERFYTEIKNYWNEIDEYDLQEDYVGIRPKIQSTNQNFADFSILTSDHHSCSGLVFLQGIESPGLTCSMAIAEYILKKLDL
jgi:L-2-hydroxyglutarate oxidase LhgO